MTSTLLIIFVLMSRIIAPSILSADFGNLEAETQMINNSQADWIHVDVMDGVFVPNITLGFPVVKAIKQHTIKPLDVHLMIVQPERYIEDFQKAGADIISVHVEASPHLHRTIQQIKTVGCKAGVAINPHTPISALNDIIQDVDLVCLMSVNPGFGGQQFIENTYSKIEDLVALIDRKNASVIIEIDGGVNSQNIDKLSSYGANAFVAGHFVFSSSDPIVTINKLKTETQPV